MQNRDLYNLKDYLDYSELYKHLLLSDEEGLRVIPIFITHL